MKKNGIARLLAAFPVAALVASTPGRAQSLQTARPAVRPAATPTPSAGLPGAASASALRGAASVIDASSMKGPEIQNLILTKPDNTQIKLGNTTLTVGQMKAHEQKLKRGSPAAGKSVALVRHKPANLDASNAKVLAHISPLATDPNVQKQAKLRDEAYDLTEKLKTASPAEKGQIQQRLQQIGSEMKLAPAAVR